MIISKNIQLEIPLNAKYKVTYAVDYLDSNPTIEYFDEWYDMQDYVQDEIQRRIDYTVQHSPFTISEEEYKEIEEYENSLIKIEEL
tara:strand:- start:1511 stop:1768 length:258 start_codon:yes stop_codon:yes gene_type:complete